VATARIHATPTQAHVAEIDRVLVHPKARGHGHGRGLLTALQAETTEAGCTLLTLRMAMDAVGARLCSALGFVSLGQIPDYERDARGTSRDGAVLWKALC
jgi:predicted GNAT superfamily acetyltransferase